MFAGARGRNHTLEEFANLGSSWRFQEKADGAYCTVHLDEYGHIRHIYSKSGHRRQDWIDAMAGLGRIGLPMSVFAGEIDDCTDAARLYREDMPCRVRLFDLLRDGYALPCAQLPYRARRAKLYRMHADVMAGHTGNDTVRDSAGNIHDKRGRFVGRHVPGSWKRVPVVALEALDAVWERVRMFEAEGVVAVNMDAPLRSRMSKRKLKPVDTRDAVVVRLAKTVATVQPFGGLPAFKVKRPDYQVAIGSVVEIAYNGWYRQDIPRHARIVRRRTDGQKQGHS